MSKVMVRDLATLTLESFMDIKPSDVLISKDLISKLHSGYGRNEYFLWAQSSCSLSDIWLQAKRRESLEYDDFGTPIIRVDTSEPPKIVAHLLAKDARYCFGEWEEKRIEIPRYKSELNNEEVALYEANFLGSKAGVDLIADLNDGHHFYDKECWVLRGKEELEVHPMALVHFMSELIEATNIRFDKIDEIINYILDLVLNSKELFNFSSTKAKGYPKDIRYSFQGILRGDNIKAWTEALEIISAPAISIARIAEPFKKMEMFQWASADNFMALNNKLGGLFLSAAEYETFIRSGSLGYGVPFNLGDIEGSQKRWLKWKTAHRGQSATKAYLEVLNQFRRILTHCSSSPVERIFARKLLRAFPTTETILLKSDLVLMESFFAAGGRSTSEKKKTDLRFSWVEDIMQEIHKADLQKKKDNPNYRIRNFGELLEKAANEEVKKFRHYLKENQNVLDEYPFPHKFRAEIEREKKRLLGEGKSREEINHKHEKMEMEFITKLSTNTLRQSKKDKDGNTIRRGLTPSSCDWFKK